MENKSIILTEPDSYQYTSNSANLTCKHSSLLTQDSSSLKKVSLRESCIRIFVEALKKNPS